MLLEKDKFYYVSDTCGNHIKRKFIGIIEEFIEHNMPAGPWTSNGNRTYKTYALFSSIASNDTPALYAPRGGLYPDPEYFILAKPILSKYGKSPSIIFETIAMASSIDKFTKSLSYKLKA